MGVSSAHSRILPSIILRICSLFVHFFLTYAARFVIKPLNFLDLLESVLLLVLASCNLQLGFPSVLINKAAVVDLKSF